MNKYSPYILYLVIALLMVVLAVNDFGPISTLQRTVDDFLCRVTAPEGPRPNVVVVDVDEESQKEYGRWPWDQDLIADLSAAVAAGEPKAILLDVTLNEDAVQATAGRTDVLVGQLSWIKQVVLRYDIAETTFRSNKTSTPEFLFNNSVSIDNPLGLMDESSSLLVRKVFLPAQKLLQHHPLLGFDYNRPDQDRLLRHQPLVMNFDGYYYPSSCLLTAATYLGVPPSEIKVAEDKNVQIGAVKSIPINERGEFQIRFSDGFAFAKYSAKQVLSDDFKREVLKNKAVVIGQINGAETEYFVTPVQKKASELMVKAAVIENIINGDIIAPRSDLANVFLLVMVALGIACALVLPRISLLHRMIFLVVAMIILANTSYWLFSSYGMMLPTACVGIELLLFMIVSPLLDTSLLSAGRAESKSSRPRDVQISSKGTRRSAVARTPRYVARSGKRCHYGLEFT
jgi:CHASE2 domain-containing sensor protein